MEQQAITETPRVPKTFRATFSHEDKLQLIKDSMYGETRISIPDFFSRYDTHELRASIIKKFNFPGGNIFIDESQRFDWEDLIIFLRQESYGTFEPALWPEVLTGYLHRANVLLCLPAMRFAIGLLEGKYGCLMSGDAKIVKIICAALNKGVAYNSGLHWDTRSSHPQVRVLSRRFMLDGLFGVLPEIVPVLQMMLNELFNSSDIMSKVKQPRVDYCQEAFTQIERALKIIHREQSFNTAFLPHIEMMATAHRARVKEIRITGNGDRSYGDLWFYPKNQIVLDESVKFLRRAAKDNAVHGAARRQEVIDNYGEPTQV